MPNIEIMQICHAINIFLKYDNHLNFMDNKAIMCLELQNVKKHWRYMAQVKDKINYF